MSSKKCTPRAHPNPIPYPKPLQVEQAVFASLKIISENSEAAGEMRNTPSWVEGINEALAVVDPRGWTQGAAGSAAER